jgi:hypothetical protein
MQEGTYYQKNRDKLLGYQRAYKIEKYYGITEAEYTERMATSDVCEICGDNASTLGYDHCHDTGDFRGVLCMPCNTGLGKLGDNLTGLLSALKYLARFYDKSKH